MYKYTKIANLLKSYYNIHGITNITKIMLSGIVIIKTGKLDNINGHYLRGLAQAEIKKNRWFYFGFLIWTYDVNMSID